MKIILTIILTHFLMMVSTDGALSDVLQTEILATEVKEKPFETPNDLRSHLNNLSHYYAIVGRPRYIKFYFYKFMGDLTITNYSYTRN